MKNLEIIYRDEYYIAVNKPPGLLVHKTELSSVHETEFALQTLRNQINQRVYPVHRLDRATSGVLLFALDSEAARFICKEFEQHQVKKEYLSVVRGIPKEEDLIDYSLKKENTSLYQDAVTYYQRLASVELDIQVDKYPKSRYSLVKVQPRTGRKHQIRRHFHHISHHIIGDTTYGKGKHNNMFREKFRISRMLLFAHSLEFIHPYSKENVLIKSELSDEIKSLFTLLGWPSVF